MKKTTDPELESFKLRINLTEYAAHLGYMLDKKATSRNCAVMRHSQGDKVVIAKGEDGHWIYFTVNDDRDNGSVIDFAMKRNRINLGQVRKELRPWIQSSEKRMLSGSFLPTLQPITRNIAAAAAKYQAADPLTGFNDYLEANRCIPSEVLLDPIFVDRIRIDIRQNCLFPHFTQSGFSGYEVKNHGFTGFAPGGEKGLWCSRPRETDRCFVITESAIDALSYAAVKSMERSRFFSTGGELNHQQPDIIQSAIRNMPRESQIIVAVDNDPGGDRLLEKIHTYLAL